jgi:hypothetical protein
MTDRARSRHRLFRRGPDKRFTTFDDLAFHCRQVRHTSRFCWETPARLTITSDLKLAIGDAQLALNDWSFGQLCGLAGLDKGTLNRLTPRMASYVLQRMLPPTERPWEILATWGTVRAIHALSYAPLWNSELISVLREFASVWRPPQPCSHKSSDLFCGEQDMFCFLIDAAGSVEIAGEEFVPGLVAWNSEVGRRPLGIRAFWYQRGCQNHLLWDPLYTIPRVRRHSGDVRQGLDQIRRVIEALERRRSERRDEFVRVVRKAQRLRLGHQPDEVLVRLLELGFDPRLARRAVDTVLSEGRLTIFAVAESLTRLSHAQAYVAERTALDTKAASLLTLAN